MAASTIVTLALISYAVAIVTEQRKRIITTAVLIFLAVGVTLDVTSTILMIIGSSRGAFTLHGALGYSSLAAMLTDTILMWRGRMQNGESTPVSRGLHLYSRVAFTWWVAAYITGGLLVALR